MNGFFKTSRLFQRTSTYFVIGLFLVVLMGMILDNLTVINNSILFTGFHIASIIGLCLACYLCFKQIKNLSLRFLFIIVVFLVWRIGYFPVLVLSGFMASLSEAVSLSLSFEQLYPSFFFSIALLNFIMVMICGFAFFLLFHRYLKTTKSHQIYHGILTSVSFPLLILAVGVSFSNPSDWHTLPDTSYIDDKPLPKASLPNVNPYWAAYDNDDLPWQQSVLFYAAGMTYDLVPEKTRWSQVVKGTLESEFIQTKEVSTAFCTKIHYRAFITAHDYLKNQSKFEALENF